MEHIVQNTELVNALGLSFTGLSVKKNIIKSLKEQVEYYKKLVDETESLLNMIRPNPDRDNDGT